MQKLRYRDYCCYAICGRRRSESDLIVVGKTRAVLRAEKQRKISHVPAVMNYVECGAACRQ